MGALPLRLVDLEPEWCADYDDGTHRRGAGITLATAQGILFDCPKCRAPEGSHSILAWFRGRVPDDALPGPGRWDPTGADFGDLTLTPSILLTSGCGWHGFIRSGEIVNA